MLDVAVMISAGEADDVMDPAFFDVVLVHHTALAASATDVCASSRSPDAASGGDDLGAMDPGPDGDPGRADDGD